MYDPIKHWNRMYRRWHQHFTAACGSGGSFGWDERTMRITVPLWYASLQRLKRLRIADLENMLVNV